MRRLLILISAFLLILFSASCSKPVENLESAPDEAAWFIVEVSGEDVFEKGYHGERILSSMPVFYSLSAVPEDDAKWSIYISDEELTDEEARALNGTLPVVTEAGDVEVKYGQWFYVFCDVNSETSEEPSKATFSISWSSGYA